MRWERRWATPPVFLEFLLPDMSRLSGSPLRVLGRLLAVGGLVLFATACPEAPSSTESLPSIAKATPHHVYECAPSDTTAFQVALHDDGDTQAVLLPERFPPQVRLVRRVRAARGIKLEGDDLVLWIKASDALVEVNGQTVRSCSRVLAPPPADSTFAPAFRALGQEPGWMLTVFPDRLWYVGNYGRRPIAFPLPEPSGDSAAFRTTYQSKTRTHTLRVVVRDTSCSDTMSGEAFPYRVSVTLNDTTHTGCGAPLS